MIPLALYGLALLITAAALGVLVGCVCLFDWAARRWGWEE